MKANITVDVSVEELKNILVEQAEKQFGRKVKKVTFDVRQNNHGDCRETWTTHELSSAKIELGDPL